MKREYIDILKKSSALLVDDHEKTRRYFRETLYVYMDEVYEAENGDEGIDMYRRYNPSIIFTDLEMPVMDGLSFTTLIRKLDPEIPIVVLSAHSERETLLEFISMNLVDYLVKPIDFDQLNSALIRCAKKLREKGLVEFYFGEGKAYSFSKKALLSYDEIIPLSPKETALLELLIQYKERLLTKEMIEDVVYNGEEMSGAAISNLISKLRKKVGQEVIKTVSTAGFILTKPL